MVKTIQRSSHKPPHRTLNKESPDSGWASSFADVTPYANGANTFDIDYDYEPHDVYSNLDISKRVDLAQFTKTPFTIAKAKSQASSRCKTSQTARETQRSAIGRDHSSSSSATIVVEPKKSIAERLAEQEAADRKGGGAIVPAIEPPKAKKEDKGNSWSNKGTSGWRNALGQPVAATRPPNKSKVLSALDKIDKKSAKAANKKKVPQAAPPAPATPPLVQAPDPKAPPKSIRERLDEIERETKTKTTLPANDKGMDKVLPKRDVKRPVSGKGIGKVRKVINKDDNISFRMIRESHHSGHRQC